MPKHIEFCIPTAGQGCAELGRTGSTRSSTTATGCRLERDGDRVRLFSKGGHDWTSRYPWIVETALKIRKSQFIIDGEAVVLGVDGISDFNALHSRKHDTRSSSTPSTAWRITATTSRRVPLHLRKHQPDAALARQSQGVFSGHLRTGRYRTGPVRSRLPPGTGGFGLQAP